MATGSSRNKGIAKWRSNKKTPAQRRAAKLDKALTPRKATTIKGGDTAPF